MTDAELVKRFRKGSKEAFSELVERYSKPLTLMILRMVRDQETARDISQNVFLKAYEGLSRFMMASSFKTWLYSIALNSVKDHLRKRGGRQVAELTEDLPDCSPSQAERLEDAILRARIRKAVEELPEKQRLTLQLRIYEGMDYKEIAGLIGGNENAARGNFFQATRTLKKRLER